MDLTLISGPTVTAPTSALTEGPGPAPGGGEALSESNRSENYRLLRISLWRCYCCSTQKVTIGTRGKKPAAGQRTSARARVVNCGGVKLKVPSKAEAPG